MPNDRLCESCAAWLCRAEDAWCGNCGAPCAQLSLSALPSILHTGLLAPRVAFKVTNRSCLDLDIEGIQSPAWLPLPARQPVKLLTGMTFTFWGDPRTETLAQPEAGQVIVVTRAGSVAVTVLAIAPRPALLAVPPQLEIWTDRKGARKTLTLSLEPTYGALKLHRVRPAIPGGALTVSRDLEDGSLATSGHGALLELTVDIDGLRSEPPPSLLVECFSPHGFEEIVFPLQILLRNPPQLRWVEQNQPPGECFQTTQHTVRFLLANQNPNGLEGGSKNGDLVIESATLKPPANHPHLPVRLLSALPVTIRGGESYPLEFEMNLESIVSSPTHPTSFTFEVRSNTSPLKQPFPLFVRERPVFDGVLAIDFGSSNTCCAVLERGREYEQLVLEDANSVCPTFIRYKSLSGPKAAGEIGTSVKAQAAAGERAAASTLSGLKQKLGEIQQNLSVRPDDADLWTTRRASDATADYLYEIRQLAELRKKAVFREFILTHPAICSLRQHRNLSLALERAFSTHSALPTQGVPSSTLESVRFLQEPIAALIPFFSTMATRADKTLGECPHYTVASFDLGGGTTDIALVRVEHRWLDSSRIEHIAETGKPLEIHTTILSCRGIRFGGEDLTDFLERRLQENCAHQLQTLDGNLVLLHKDLPGVPTADKLLNRAALRNAAEQFKASLSEENARPEPSQIILRVQTIATRDTRDYTFDFRALRRTGDSDLRDEFLAFARQQITRAATLLQNAVSGHNEPLDFIQLSGKTSFLPVVRDVLRNLFPSTEIKRAANPKECVVAGACLLRAMTSRRALRRLVLPEGNQRTTSNIGILSTESGRFQVILPIDVIVTPEGLARDLPGYWEGEEPVVIWEDLGTDVGFEAPGDSSLGRMLNKLGTWQPQRTLAMLSAFWALRLTLKGFDLHISAIGPAGETVLFERADNATEL